MKKALFIVAVVVTAGGAFVEWWRRHRRFGSNTVNRIVNPWLMRTGVADKSAGEIGLLEHVGRTSGTVRVTPVHPVRTPDGIRIVVPLGGESQWARNVLAAGHCRLQMGDTVYDLDEPRIVSPHEIEELPPTAAGVMDWLGFQYLVLHRFAERPGPLERPEPESQRPEAAEAAASPVEREAVLTG